MNFHYPLESLARRRSGRSQLDFAREARRLFSDTDEVMYEPIDRGLAIFAAHEDALEEPKRILKDLYGDFVEVRGPRVRYMPGEPAHEPIMHVRVTTRRETAGAIVRELRGRGVRMIEECVRSRVFVVRAEAPLAALLGLPARIDEISDGLAMHSIRLIRYAPVAAHPDDDGPHAA